MGRTRSQTVWIEKSLIRDEGARVRFMLVLMVFFWDLKSIIKNMIRVLPSKLLKARTKRKWGCRF